MGSLSIQNFVSATKLAIHGKTTTQNVADTMKNDSFNLNFKFNPQKPSEYTDFGGVIENNNYVYKSPENVDRSAALVDYAKEADAEIRNILGVDINKVNPEQLKLFTSGVTTIGLGYTEEHLAGQSYPPTLTGTDPQNPDNKTVKITSGDFLNATPTTFRQVLGEILAPFKKDKTILINDIQTANTPVPVYEKK
ncbi:MAG: hypothetical protein WCK67_01610 [bacterium]